MKAPNYTNTIIGINGNTDYSNIISLKADGVTLASVNISTSIKSYQTNYFALSVSDGVLFLGNDTPTSTITGQLVDGKVLCYLRPSKSLDNNVVLTLNINGNILTRQLQYSRVFPDSIYLSADKYIAGPSEIININATVDSNNNYITPGFQVSFSAQLLDGSGSPDNYLLSPPVVYSTGSSQVVTTKLSEKNGTDVGHVSITATTPGAAGIITKQIVVQFK